MKHCRPKTTESGDQIQQEPELLENHMIAIYFCHERFLGAKDLSLIKTGFNQGFDFEKLIHLKSWLLTTGHMA